MKKKLVILSGSGISQESGLKTFRETGGLWEDYNVYEVATPEAWERNPKLVLNFYNERRKQLMDAKPNNAHIKIAELEKDFDVHVITQNVDDLHERGGSTKVLHLHGELWKARSTSNPKLIYKLEHWKLKIGDKCEEGSQLRPHIVWFGEQVPAMFDAESIVRKAEIFVVIGTSMAVYPAAGLIHYAKPGIPIFVINPEQPSIYLENIEFIKAKAAAGVDILIKKLKNIS